MRIIGAGLSGLIAAYAFPSAPIYERNPPRESHKALLRFRSDAVSRITNIPFRKVTVHKAIWDDGYLVEPSVKLCNQYSEKVSGRVLNRSVWNIDPVTRYIAPDDLYERLLDHLQPRIHWGVTSNVLVANGEGPTISTIPLSILAPHLGSQEQFSRKGIHVYRWIIEDCDVFQTVYIPAPEEKVYRMSITGNLLIVECMSELTQEELGDAEFFIEDAFGISASRAKFISKSSQEFGKIAPINENERRRLVSTLTREHGVYSLGRFATWRNILLDDVVTDIDVIKQLMEADDYSQSIFAAKRTES